MKIRILALGLLALCQSAFGDTFSLFSPSNGILKGDSNTYVTTPATSSDIRLLWTGSCTTLTFFRGDGACSSTLSGTAPTFTIFDSSTSENRLRVMSDGGILLGNPTGGSQGPGSINMSSAYINGSPVGTSSGAVSSVALSAPSVFTVTGSPVTAAGTLTLTFAGGQTANRVLASPDGIAGAISLRALVTGDIPALGANPSATIGLTAVNGSATTYHRSDSAPALSQSIVPTWTGLHTFNGGMAGNASGLTSLNGSNISSGTVSDSRLSSNVPLKNAANTFTAAQSISSTLGVGNGTPSSDNTAILIYRSNTGSVATGRHAVRDETVDTASGGGLIAYASFDAIPTAAGSANWSHLHAFQARPAFTSSGTNGEVAGLTYQLTQNGGTVANSLGVRVSDALGSGTITSQTALYVDDLTRGASSNYAIYSVGSAVRSYHAGAFQFGSTVISTGDLIGAGIPEIYSAASQPFYIGTSGAQPVVLFTNSAGRVTIGATTGAVQVGTPMGGDPGSGGVNVAGPLQKNGVNVCLSDGTNCQAGIVQKMAGAKVVSSTCTISSNPGSVFTSCIPTTAGVFSLTIPGGYYSAAPVCTATIEDASGFAWFARLGTSSTQVTVTLWDITGSSNVNGTVHINCLGT